MDTEQIISLIEAVASSGLGEFEYEQGDVRLHLKAKKPACIKTPMVEVPANMQTGAMPVDTAPVVDAPAVTLDSGNDMTINDDEVVKSPLVGTFYSAPAEGEAPYISVGDTVKKGQIIGIVETMKLMNEVESDRDGVVSAILIENEQVVEFGQPLVAIS